MRNGWVVAVGAAVALVLVAVVVAGVVTARRSGPAGQPPVPTPTGDVGTVSTRLPAPDDSYWDPDRMRSALPAPMPTD
ncbi:hypothetical protein C5N14_08165 [Micromonospora sp. MW-13]|uniref:hypothetical protein n=1 Tax=Micromonospora sp. MW-13 TaxID=2094022 RepID=UPI000E43F31F|nr:hypothetical protein [Micromonospora sp. MW-13]RGC69232.1 hypothetical protein C5N14_08165 [Micromonospora sp. MW-13]